MVSPEFCYVNFVGSELIMRSNIKHYIYNNWTPETLLGGAKINENRRCRAISIGQLLCYQSINNKWINNARCSSATKGGGEVNPLFHDDPKTLGEGCTFQICKNQIR
jgi:hypothetical protein